MFKKTLAAALSVVFAFSVCPEALADFGYFTEIKTYGGEFTDVPQDAWYCSYVSKCYELGLMNGSSKASFVPEGNLTLAEAITIADRLYSIYGTGAEFDTSKYIGEYWYSPYLDYAFENGIITSAIPDYNVPATRSQVAVIFSKALPEEAFAEICTVPDGAVPDVSMYTSYAPAVYRLYRAGIITGSDKTGTFHPSDYITRAEIATICVRMALPSSRSVKDFSASSGSQMPSQGTVTTPASSELSAEEIYAKCSPGVFYIEVYDRAGYATGSGSGFFISPDGMAVTNYHVIDGAYTAKITLPASGEVYDVAGVYDYDENEDWAVLRIGGSGFSPLTVSEREVVGGAAIYAIGSPRGLQNTISSGIISSPSRLLGDVPHIQFSAPISPGSSGGALINAYGEVIGITASTRKDSQNLNFALPIRLISRASFSSVVTPLASLTERDPGYTAGNGELYDVLSGFVVSSYTNKGDGWYEVSSSTEYNGATYVTGLIYWENTGLLSLECVVYEKTLDVYMYLDLSPSGSTHYYDVYIYDKGMTDPLCTASGKVEASGFTFGTPVIPEAFSLNDLDLQQSVSALTSSMLTISLISFDSLLGVIDSGVEAFGFTGFDSEAVNVPSSAYDRVAQYLISNCNYVDTDGEYLYSGGTALFGSEYRFIFGYDPTEDALTVSVTQPFDGFDAMLLCRLTRTGDDLIFGYLLDGGPGSEISAFGSLSAYGYTFGAPLPFDRLTSFPTAGDSYTFATHAGNLLSVALTLFDRFITGCGCRVADFGFTSFA